MKPLHQAGREIRIMKGSEAGDTTALVAREAWRVH